MTSLKARCQNHYHNLTISYSRTRNECTDGCKQTHEHTLLPGIEVEKENCMWQWKKIACAPAPTSDLCFLG